MQIASLLNELKYIAAPAGVSLQKPGLYFGIAAVQPRLTAVNEDSLFCVEGTCGSATHRQATRGLYLWSVSGRSRNRVKVGVFGDKVNRCARNAAIPNVEAQMTALAQVSVQSCNWVNFRHSFAH